MILLLLQTKRASDETDGGQEKKQKTEEELEVTKKLLQEALARVHECEKDSEAKIQFDHLKKELMEALDPMKKFMAHRMQWKKWQTYAGTAQATKKLVQMYEKLLDEHVKLEKFAKISTELQAEDLQAVLPLLNSWMEVKDQPNYKKNHVSCYAALLPSMAKLVTGNMNSKSVAFKKCLADLSLLIEHTGQSAKSLRCAASLIDKHGHEVLQTLAKTSKEDVASLLRGAADWKQVQAHCKTHGVSVMELLERMPVTSGQTSEAMDDQQMLPQAPICEQQAVAQSQLKADYEAQIAVAKATAKEYAHGWNEAAICCQRLVSVTLTKLSLLFTMIIAVKI